MTIGLIAATGLLAALLLSGALLLLVLYARRLRSKRRAGKPAAIAIYPLW